MTEQYFKISKTSGYDLHASLFKKGNENLVIMCHGGLGDRYEHGRFPHATKMLTENGFDVLCFDFSGSGENERIPFLTSFMIIDLETVWKWAKQQNYDSINTIGLSLGGLVSMCTTLPGRKCAVFWAPAFYVNDFIPPFFQLITKIVPKHSKATLKLKSSGMGPKIRFTIGFINELLELNVEKYLNGFTIPTLFVQGTRDRVVNPESTKKAFNLLPHDDKHILKMVKGAPHDFKGAHLDEFITHTLTFLKDNL